MISYAPFLKKAQLSEDIHKAYLFASRAHEGQERHGGKPYIEHPLAVAALVSEHYVSAHEDMVMAALLHDVVEDTPYTLEDIWDKFGERVARLVRDLTDPEQEEGETRNQYFKRVRARWPGFSQEAKVIKCADRLHNLRSLPESHWDARTKAGYAKRSLEMIEAFYFREPVKLADLVKIEAMKWEG